MNFKKCVCFSGDKMKTVRNILQECVASIPYTSSEITFKQNCERAIDQAVKEIQNYYRCL